MNGFREIKHRLPDEAYVGKRTVAYTLCVRDHRRPFVEENIVDVFSHKLRICAEAHHCLVPIYCFMPNHLHILIQGREENSRIKQSIEEFKFSTGSWFHANKPELSWQKDYYDHIIRKSQDWRNQAFYIFQNPVRAGLVADPYDYPFTGSIGFNLGEMLHDLYD